MIIAFSLVFAVTPTQAEDDESDDASDQEVNEQTEEEEEEEEEDASPEEEKRRGGPTGVELPENASERAHQVQECLKISRMLKKGVSGEEVEKLQEFLKEKGHFDHEETTKYYGNITEEAVKKFQKAEGIVDSGDPESTGFGQVGPKTRAQIGKVSCLTEGVGDEDEAADTDKDEDEKKDEAEELEAKVESLETEVERLTDLLNNLGYDSEGNPLDESDEEKDEEEDGDNDEEEDDDEEDGDNGDDEE